MLQFPATFPDTAPVATPLRYLGWHLRRNVLLLLPGIALSTLGFLSIALTPLFIGRAIDEGLGKGVTAALWWNVAAILGLGLANALGMALRHLFEVWVWMRTAITNSHLVGNHVTRTGAAINRQRATGEVVATVATDSHHIGDVVEHLPVFLGGIITYLAIGVLLLGESFELGLMVFLGLPVVTSLLSVLVPQLHARQAQHREAQGKLTALASDTVSGLRILRGIGGEDVFAARYQAQSQQVLRAGVSVANTQAILAALQTFLPGAFVVAVVWLGAHLTLRGEITPGQLVAFFGYTAFLAVPLQQVGNFIQFLTRARVSAQKVKGILDVTPDAGTLSDRDASGSPLPYRAEAGQELLADLESGLSVAAGQFTMLVSATPACSAAAVHRLARLDDKKSEGTLFDGAAALSYPLADYRATVLLSDTTPQLFTGPLREEVDVRGSGDQFAVVAALGVADARDVIESVGGLDGEITEKGRSLSGGQRQRVALARAVALRPPVLLLVEPTSAVDAHTEARIARNLKANRRGATTVVVSTSPLLLEHADSVVFLDETGVRAAGTHKALMERARAGEPAAQDYYRVVTRREDLEEVPDAASSS